MGDDWVLEAVSPAGSFSSGDENAGYALPH